MIQIKPFVRFGSVLLLLSAMAGCATAPSGGKHHLVIQVSDSDTGTWNQAINVSENVPALLGKENVDVEIVAFGKGIGMFKFDSEVGARLKKANDNGVGLRACGVTMRKNNLTEKDLFPGVTMVPAGVVEIMTRHEQGWSVIRP